MEQPRGLLKWGLFECQSWLVGFCQKHHVNKAHKLPSSHGLILFFHLEKIFCIDFVHLIGWYYGQSGW